MWAVDEAGWISFLHHLTVPHDPHDAPHVMPAPCTVANRTLPTGWPRASWLPPHDQKKSDKRRQVLTELTAHQHQGREASLAPHFLVPEPAVKGGCCLVLSSVHSTLSLAVSPQLIRCFVEPSWYKNINRNSNKKKKPNYSIFSFSAS